MRTSITRPTFLLLPRHEASCGSRHSVCICCQCEIPSGCLSQDRSSPHRPAPESVIRRAITPHHEPHGGVESGASLESSFSSGIASSTAAVAGESSAPQFCTNSYVSVQFQALNQHIMLAILGSVMLRRNMQCHGQMAVLRGRDLPMPCSLETYVL